ncbi:MAG: nuclear transport factor 2 family protein [Leptolyngbya sp. SIO1E4]|nr:nuclear transport factor 2 family protein [Leptolyngbya sp. SIO1E4]
MTDTTDKFKVLKAVSEGSERWKVAFNTGDAAGCAAQYEDSVVMHTRPFGTFNGADDIKTFWQNLITDGYAEVEYIDPKIEVLDDKTAILTSRWRMNKASGVIHKELWAIQEDGRAKICKGQVEGIDRDDVTGQSSFSHKIFRIAA